MSTLYVDNLEPNLGSRVLAAGHVVQVVNSIETNAISSNTTTFAAPSGLTVNITPTSSTSKILITANVNNVSVTTGTLALARLVRDSTVLAAHSSGSGIADTAGAFYSGGGGAMAGSTYTGQDVRKVNSGGISYTDSPATTSTLTYKIEIATATASDTVYLNRWALNSDMGSTSSITVMEIAQ